MLAGLRRLLVLVLLLSLAPPLTLTAAQVGVPAAKDLQKVSLVEVPKRDKLALVIGVGDYKNVADLKSTVSDADSFARFLKERMGFPEDSVVLLTDQAANPDDRPTYIRLLAAFDALVKSADENSVVVVFYSGHGVREQNQDWLVPSDGHPNLVTRTCISTTEFLSQLEGRNPARALVFFDACRNLGAGKDITASQFGSDNNKTNVPQVAVMYSCKPGEVSWESHPQGDFKQGVFTHFLMKGLAGDPAATDPATGNITYDSLYQYVNGSVRQYARKWFDAPQTPIGRCLAGNMVLVRGEKPPSTDVVALTREAKILAFDGDYAAAEAKAREALQHDGKIPDAHLVLGMVYFGQQRFDQAIESCRKALELNPNLMMARQTLDAAQKRKGEMDAPDLLRLAREHLAAKRLDMADAAARQALAGNSANAEARLVLARVFLEQKKYDAAAQEYNEVLRSQDLPEARTGLQAANRGRSEAEAATLAMEARQLLAGGRAPAAVEKAQKALEVHAGSVEAHLVLAIAYAGPTLRQYADAERHFEKVRELNPDLREAADGLAMVRQAKADADAVRLIDEARGLLAGNRLDDAEAKLVAARAANPRSAEPHELLGQLRFQQKRYMDALAAYDAALKLDPNAGQARRNRELVVRTLDLETSRRLAAEATRLLADRKAAEAAAKANEALTRDPKNAEARLVVARVHAGEKNYEQAVSAFQEVLQLDPGSAAAKEGLDAVLKAKGTADAGVLAGEATRLFQGGKLPEAAAKANEAVARDAKNADAHLILAQIHAAERRHEEAARQFRTVLDLRPDLPAAKQGLEAALKEQRLVDGRRLVEQASELLLAGKLPEAEGKARAALEADPASADARLILGQSHLAQKRYDAAVREYEEALRLRSDLAPAKAGLAEARRELTLVEARQLAGEATRLLADRKAAEAAAKASEALTRDPRNADAHLVLAQVYAAEKKHEEAAREFRTVLQLSPGLAAAKQGLEAALKERQAGDLQRRLTEARELIALDRLDQAEAKIGELLQGDPSNADAVRLLGQVHFKQRRYDEAIRRYTELQRLQPADTQVKEYIDGALKAKHLAEIRRLVDEAEDALINGRLPDAEAKAREAMRKDPENALAVLALGNVQLEQKRFDDAVQSFDRALALDLTLIEAREQKQFALRQKDTAEANRLAAEAVRLLAAGQSADAVKKAGEALKLNPRGSAQAYYVQARVHASDRQWDLAIEKYQQALKWQLAFPEAQEGLNAALKAKGDMTDVTALVARATGLLKEARDIRPTPGAGFEAKTRDRIEKKLAEAEAPAREARARDPKNVPARLVLGEVFLERKLYADALQEYQEVEQIQPSHPEAARGRDRVQSARRTEEAATLVEQAYGLLIRDEYVDARRKALDALDRDPKSADAYAALGYAALFLGEDGTPSAEAVKAIDRALELDPRSALAHLAQGTLLYVKQNPKDAEKELREALQIDENRALTLNNLAAVLGSLGERRKAIDYAERAVKLDPGYAYAYANLGNLYFRAGLDKDSKVVDSRRIEQALTQYDRAIQLEPRAGTFYEAKAAALLSLKNKPDAEKAAQEAIRRGIWRDWFEKDLKLTP